MKTKEILISIALLLGALGVNAQEWRGLLEIYAGISPQKTSLDFTGKTFGDVSDPLVFGLNYTMGIKVHPQIIAGIGIGGYTSYPHFTDEGGYNLFPALYFPVFANVRWLPCLSKKIQPYLDLKIGYSMGVDLDDNSLWGYPYDTYFARHKNGLFLQPGIGLRFGRESAFNVGLAYNATMGYNFVSVDPGLPDIPVKESISKSWGAILLTLGAEF